MLTDLQRRTAQAIVAIYETGKPQGGYDMVTVTPGDTGHLTYGRSQATLASGNLYLLLKAYVEDENALFSRELLPFLDRARALDTSLDHNEEFRDLLKRAGSDPAMHDTQDAFFDRLFWTPATRAARAISVEEPLSVTVVYDSLIHGSWPRLRDRTMELYGTPAGLGEHEWIEKYIATRHDWLAHHSNRLLRRTVYRMDSFQQLITDRKWELRLPVYVRGIRVDRAALGAPPLRISAEEDKQRLLLLQEPMMEGEDVQAVQQSLRDEGYELAVDGIYGPETEQVVRAFQEREELQVDGIVGPATRSALGWS